MTWPAQTPSPNPPRAGVMAVVGEVASELRVSSEDICGLTTSRGVAKARHEVWRRLKTAGWTNSGIARTWGCHPSSISTATKPFTRTYMEHPIIPSATEGTGETITP